MSIQPFFSHEYDLETSGVFIWTKPSTLFFIRMQITEQNAREFIAILSGPQHQRCPHLPILFK